MFNKLKNKITENSGVVNMIINLSILYLLFTVASGIKSLSEKVTQIQQQTQATIQPVGTGTPIADDDLQRLILDVLIAKLQQAQIDLKR
jgi:predicted PurR-regulated permease PerM